MYFFGKMKDAEHEKDSIEADYRKESQNFESQPKWREALESKRNKKRGEYAKALSNYERAAREAEPLLRQLTVPQQPPTPAGPTLDEDEVRRMIRAELRQQKEFVRFQDIDNEMKMVERKLRRDLDSDVRKTMSGELRNYTEKREVVRLAEQIREISSRARQSSVSSDTSREMDQRILAQAREIESLKADLAKLANQHTLELVSLKDKVVVLQKEKSRSQPKRIQMPGASGHDIVKVHIVGTVLIVGGIGARESPGSHQRSVRYNPRS